MSRAARTARTPSSPTTAAATGIAPSVRAPPPSNGSPSARPSCLPVPYFHVVFTLPAADRRHRLPEQGRDLRSPVQGGGRDHAHDRGRSQAPGCQHRHHRRAPHLGLGAHPPSACAHDRAGRRHLARRTSAGSSCRPSFFLPVRVLSRLFRRLFLQMLTRRAQGRPPQLLRQPRRTRRHQSIHRLPRAAAQDRVGGLCQEAVRRAAGRARLSVALHPPRRHLQSPADLSRR